MGPEGLVYARFPPYIPDWCASPRINNGSRGFGFLWDFHLTYLAAGSKSRSQLWVPRVWVYVRFPPYIPGFWPHVQESIMGPESLGLCEISTLHTWMLAPCPWVNHGSWEWVYVRFPPYIPGCWPHVHESIMGPKGLGLYEISTLDTWLLAPCPGINHGSRGFGFVWDFHPTYLAVGPMSWSQWWVPRVWVYVRFLPYIPGCWPHVQESIMGSEGLSLCEIST